ncbi:uncharacterized protein BYT42DRAFT_641379, partial [Radiomyces spectabilis]|uniref:uncharacterized protein n=1 Tax=Radiomyces spectabilis TaxID=64574 RepID=UPI00221E7785
MRTSRVRITSLVVLSPILLIALSLTTIFTIAIVSQLKQWCGIYSKPMVMHHRSMSRFATAATTATTTTTVTYPHTSPLPWSDSSHKDRTLWRYSPWTYVIGSIVLTVSFQKLNVEKYQSIQRQLIQTIRACRNKMAELVKWHHPQPPTADADADAPIINKKHKKPKKKQRIPADHHYLKASPVAIERSQEESSDHSSAILCTPPSLGNPGLHVNNNIALLAADTNTDASTDKALDEDALPGNTNPPISLPTETHSTNKGASPVPARISTHYHDKAIHTDMPPEEKDNSSTLVSSDDEGTDISSPSLLSEDPPTFAQQPSHHGLKCPSRYSLFSTGLELDILPRHDLLSSGYDPLSRYTSSSPAAFSSVYPSITPPFDPVLYPPQSSSNLTFLQSHPFVGRHNPLHSEPHPLGPIGPHHHHHHHHHHHPSSIESCSPVNDSQSMHVLYRKNH